MGDLRIVCAAVRHPDGRIVCGPRHLDKTMLAQITGLSMEGFHDLLTNGDGPSEACKVWGWKGEEGFIDQYGVFHTREEAWNVADAGGQIIEKERNWCNGSLHSEHLY